MSDIQNWLVNFLVFGVIAGLAAGYLKPLVDRVLSRIFTAYRKRQDQDWKKYKEMLDTMIKDPSKDNDVRYNSIIYEIKSGIYAIETFLLVVLLFVTAQFLVSSKPQAEIFVMFPIALLLLGVFYTWYFWQHYSREAEEAYNLSKDASDMREIRSKVTKKTS